jgi:hypothetical protein
MDPFIEDQEWEDFHPTFNTILAEKLGQGLKVKFVARIQRDKNGPLDDPLKPRQTSVVIRDVASMEIVTVIETLSPANKRASSDGREQYLEKRQEILQSRTNLVEIDLLRGGKRLPVMGMPSGDYFAIISRGYRRPKADVYPWTIRQPLPTIPIPLRKDEPEVVVDLQQVFTTVYDRAAYELSLNYGVPLHHPLTPEEASWVKQLPLEAVRQQASAGKKADDSRR